MEIDQKLKRDTVVVLDRVYVPHKLVNKDKVRENYIVLRYDNKMCSRCDYGEDRHHYLCDTCQGFKGKIQLYSVQEINGRKYYGLPLGDKKHLKKKAGLPSWIWNDLLDLRAKPKLRLDDLEFTGKLRDYQKSARKQWMEKKYGQLMAPPRSGKTVLIVNFTVKLGTRTLILAHQSDLLKQILESFHEFTNIKDVEFDKRRQLIGIAEKRADIMRWPIVLSTYQKFNSEKGQKFLKKIKRRFGAVFADEIHKSAARCFSRAISVFEARYKGGFTATPKRKDGLEFVVESIIGPVTSEVNPPQVKPRVYVHLTKVRPARKYKLWTPAMQFLSKDKDRMKMIVKQAVKDVEFGHHIVIPVTFVKHANTLADEISKALEKKFGKSNLAVAFTGKTANRTEVLKRAKDGKIKVIVGIRSLIQAGINIPRWSALYEIAPISNVPNHTQETARVRTPMEGKPQPIIRHFVDEEIGMCVGCFKTCFQVYRYFEIAEESKEIINTVMRTKTFTKTDPDDEFKVHRSKEGGFGGLKTKSHQDTKKNQYGLRLG